MALLVVAPDAAVARWCAQPIPLGHPGFVLQPLVMGPEAIPVITDEQVARQEPELAVLSAMAHGQQEVGPAIARTVLSAVGGLDAERVRLYVDLTLASLLEVLDARGLEVDAESRQRIQACTDLAQLKVWLRKAVTVDSVQELFERGPAPRRVARKASTQERSLKAPKPRSKR